jgi:hypothetical protein
MKKYMIMRRRGKIRRERRPEPPLPPVVVVPASRSMGYIGNIKKSPFRIELMIIYDSISHI